MNMRKALILLGVLILSMLLGQMIFSPIGGYRSYAFILFYFLFIITGQNLIISKNIICILFSYLWNNSV
jgi:hypothetical protein